MENCINIPPRPSRRPRWSLEMIEAGLIHSGIDYDVTDTAWEAEAAEPGTKENGFIEFELPTMRYRNTSRRRRVRVRLTVTDGRLSMTAPNVYRVGSLRRSTDPPPDAAGRLRLLRMGDDDQTILDLIMAADSTIFAEIHLDTLVLPFNRNDIPQIAREFALGIDLLDFAVRKCRLRLRRPQGSP